MAKKQNRNGNGGNGNNGKMSKNTKIAVGVGAGLAVAAAAAAGAYFLYGKDGAKNRRKVKGWALKVKGEVLDQMERLKDMNEEVYNQIIDKVSGRYAALKNVDKAELAAIVADMRRHWRSISSQIGAGAPKGGAKKGGPKGSRKGGAAKKAR